MEFLPTPFLHTEHGNLAEREYTSQAPVQKAFVLQTFTFILFSFIALFYLEEAHLFGEVTLMLPVLLCLFVAGPFSSRPFWRKFHENNFSDFLI